MGVLKSIKMLDDQTVEIVFPDDIIFDLEGIQLSYKETLAFTGGKKFKRLVICGKRTDITKEARQYGLQENERLTDTVTAEAGTSWSPTTGEILPTVWGGVAAGPALNICSGVAGADPQPEISISWPSVSPLCFFPGGKAKACST